MVSAGYRTLSARAGGKWALSWQAYVISLPLSILAIIGAAGKHATRAEQFTRIFEVSIATNLLVGLFLYSLHKTWFKNRSKNPVSMGTLVVTGIIASCIFSVGIEFAKICAGIPPSQNITGQLIANSGLITWWGISTSLILDNRERFGRSRDLAIRSAIDLEQVTLRGSETEERLRTALNKQISSEVSEARSVVNAAVNAARTSTNDLKWIPLADLIRNISDDVMRPLSKRLWDSAEILFPRPGFTMVLRTIVNSQPLRPLSMALIVILLSTETLLNNFGWRIGLTVLLATIAFVFVLMPGANLAIRKFEAFHWVIFLAAICGFQLFDTFAWVWAGNTSGSRVTLGTLVLNLIATPVLIVMTSGYGAYVGATETSLKDFRASLSKRELSTLAKNRVVSALALQAAKKLHGRVQTRLLSCANAIDRAAETGDIDLLGRALVEVNEIFDEATLIVEDDVSLTLREQLAEVAAPWAGLCEIVFEFEPFPLDMKSKLIGDIAQVVEEGITNAVRHGQASRIRVEIVQSADSIDVLVSDDGYGLVGTSQGVGTELIRIVSSGVFYYLSNELGGTDLKLSISRAGY
jgi:two-component sensor histidine kinase